jgi:prophage DNA circulation protein
MKLGAWFFNLVKANWRGATFEVQRTRDDRQRRWVEHQYPGTDGADIEDMGAQPRDTTLTAVYVGDNYLGELGKLVTLVADGKSGTFRHPLLGTYRARLQILSIDHEAARRDSCVVEIQVKESDAGNLAAPLSSVYMLKSEVTDWIDEAGDALDAIEDALDAIEDGVDSVNDALDEARDFVTNSTARATQVVRRMNNVTRKIDKATKKVKKLGELDSYPLMKALRGTDRSTKKLGRRVLGTKWPIRSRTVPVPTPAVLLAHQLFGDKTRADELVELNAGLILNPAMIPAGIVLKVFNS